MSKKLTLKECKTLNYKEALKRYDECKNELTDKEAIDILIEIRHMKDKLFPPRILTLEEALIEWKEDGTLDECALDEEDMKFYEEKFGPINWDEVL